MSLMTVLAALNRVQCSVTVAVTTAQSAIQSAVPPSTWCDTAMVRALGHSRSPRRLPAPDPSCAMPRRCTKEVRPPMAGGSTLATSTMTSGRKRSGTLSPRCVFAPHHPPGMRAFGSTPTGYGSLAPNQPPPYGCSPSPALPGMCLIPAPLIATVWNHHQPVLQAGFRLHRLRRRA